MALSVQTIAAQLFTIAILLIWKVQFRASVIVTEYVPVVKAVRFCVWFEPVMSDHL